ncbi:sirohydrochlorin chelatase [Pseudonocardia eucalypti]|uniref:Sirohydrochlorin chelatase n=1 Tax=Pseudonocardia eucalypti TaxID=648755 RepID=A0ABP9RAS6_9PSEU|nr:sirohydrochlorin ferrochelatase [Pseudonocardia eucalypti]
MPPALSPLGAKLGAQPSGPAAPALIAVAHGSRDPRSAATIAALLDEVRRQRPDLDARLSFLDLNTPRLPDVLNAVAADGHRHAVVVPLLLGNAFHARVDIPGAVARAAHRLPRLHLSVADVLGGDPRLADTALRRLAEVAGPLDDPSLGVLLAATGSSHPAANAAVRRLAGSLGRRRGWRWERAAFATMAAPKVPEAIRLLRAAGAERIAVASWFLAPGLLPARVAKDALATDPDALVASPLGADPAVAEVVLDRYQAAAATPFAAAS